MGETAILNLQTGTYYGLDEVGSRIWSLIQEPVSASEIRDAILREYDVEPDRCERDLLNLLNEMAIEGLVEVVQGEARGTHREQT